MYRRTLLGGALAAPAILSIPVRAQGAITLNGASQFNDDHAFTRAMVRFEELVKQYYGKPINFVLHKNSSLGLEKQYFEYMAQGRAVDYAIVSPAHMSTFSRAAPFIDAPFIFRSMNHWNQVLGDLCADVAIAVDRLIFPPRVVPEGQDPGDWEPTAAFRANPGRVHPCQTATGACSRVSERRRL